MVVVVLTLDGDGNDDGDNDDGDDGDGISTGTGAAGGSHVGRRRILKRHSDGDRDAVKTGGDLCDDHLEHLQLPLHILSWCLAALMAQPCLFYHQLLKLKDACHTPELLWCICVLMCLCISNN